MIYLDHNATTAVDPAVVDAMLPWFTERFANPSSSHPHGREARQAIDRAREQVAHLVGASPSEVVFTGSGTEASNLALRGVMSATPRTVLAHSSIEHPATTEPAAHLARHGVQVVLLPVQASGRVDLEQAAHLLPETLGLLSVMHANNETGIVQPVRPLADLAHAQGAWVHTDAAQTVGKIPVDVNALGADLLTIAGHKLYGPKGIGALIVRGGVAIHPVLRGAGHERGLRPGTENVPAIVGLGVAAHLAAERLPREQASVSARTERLWARLRQGLPALQRTGDGPRLPNTLHIRRPGSGRAWLERCPALAAGTGSACHAGVESPSPVLSAMGLSAEDALGAVRLSLGRSTTDSQVDEAAAALIAAY